MPSQLLFIVSQISSPIDSQATSLLTNPTVPMVVHSTSDVTIAAIAKPESREIDKNTTARASAMFCSATPCQAQEKNTQDARGSVAVFCHASEAKKTGEGRGEGG